MPMTNLINVCAQCGQTGRNADKIPHHTSEVNYVRIVLHCAISQSYNLLQSYNLTLLQSYNFQV